MADQAAWAAASWRDRARLVAALPHRVVALLAAEWAEVGVPVLATHLPDAPVRTPLPDAIRNWVLRPLFPGHAAAVTWAATAVSSSPASLLRDHHRHSMSAAEWNAHLASTATPYAEVRAAAGLFVAATHVVAHPANVGAVLRLVPGVAALADPRWTDQAACVARLGRTYLRAAGPPGATFDPAWRTPDAVAVARGVFETGEGQPVLADALEETGCAVQGVLDDLRDVRDATRADWAVWNLLDLGAPIPSDPARFTPPPAGPPQPRDPAELADMSSQEDQWIGPGSPPASWINRHRRARPTDWPGQSTR